MWIEGTIAGNVNEQSIGKKILVNTEHIRDVIEAGPDSCYLGAGDRAVLVNFNYDQIRELIEELYTIRPFKVGPRR